MTIRVRLFFCQGFHGDFNFNIPADHPHFKKFAIPHVIREPGNCKIGLKPGDVFLFIKRVGLRLKEFKYNLYFLADVFDGHHAFQCVPIVF